MRNYWWWLIGGGIGLFLIKKASADSPPDRVPGNLAVALKFKPGTNTLVAVNNALNVISAMADCGGPPILSAGTPSVVGAVVNSVFVASWKTTSSLGPIKAAVQACLLKRLQAKDPNVLDFQATRVS